MTGRVQRVQLLLFPPVWERCSACRDLPCIAPGGPEIPPPVPPIAEDPAPVPKTIVQKAPPKAPSQESGSGLRTNPDCRDRQIQFNLTLWNQSHGTRRR